MKQKLITLLLTLVVTGGAWAQSLLVGDADQNGELTIADVTKSVNMVVGKEAQTMIDLTALAYKVDNTSLVGTWYVGGFQAVTFGADGTTDYDGASTYKFRPLQGSLMLYDGGTLVKTLTVLEIADEGLVLRDEGGTIQTCSSTILYVDLGLPSGTLWATRNVGATNPEDYGDYFAWGETEPKDTYNISTYKWLSGTSTSTLTKYCQDSSQGDNGFTDELTELELSDDAAYVNWGSEWRMPSYDQQTELFTECTWTQTTQNGVNGRLVTGPNGNSIFLPAAGYRFNSWHDGKDSYGHYWSRTLYQGGPAYAHFLDFNSDRITPSYYHRTYGRSVRPVRAQ